MLTSSEFDQMTSDLTAAKNNLDQLYQNLVDTYNPGTFLHIDLLDHPLRGHVKIHNENKNFIIVV